VSNKINIFDQSECLSVSHENLDKATKEYRKQSFKSWFGILLFPGLYFLMIIFNQLYIEPPLSMKMIILYLIPNLFFSYIIYSGHLGLTKALRKKIAINKNALNDLKAIEQLIDTGGKYIFYLRDYTTGANIHSSNLVKNPTFIGGYSQQYNYGSLRMEKVSNLLEKYFPIVMLNNTRDKTEEYKGHILHCPDDLWFDYFKILADHATIIVMDYQGEFYKSTAIISEIEYVKPLEKAFVFVGTEKDLNEINKIGGLKQSARIVAVETKNHDPDKGFVVIKGKEQEVSFEPDFENWLASIKAKN
jgi:hypothetical protein